jgi:putative NIF3 family GTP cyclohydrolase 1 type 2
VIRDKYEGTKKGTMSGIAQTDLIALLDSFFEINRFNESTLAEYLAKPVIDAIGRYAVPGFINGSWIGLWLDNTKIIDRVYLVVMPTQAVIDTILAREVQRGAPGALIFGHHLFDPRDEAPGQLLIPDAQMLELREHHISYYVCHAPLDCHPTIGTSTAFATALKLRDGKPFAPRAGGFAGIYGELGPIGFNELAKRAADVTALPALRYSSLRHNGRPIQRVAVVAGLSRVTELQAVVELDIDTLITGEWWSMPSSGTQTNRQTAVHEFLQQVRPDLNIIGTSRYASEAIVMRGDLHEWFRANVPGVETQFVVQESLW